MNARKQSVPFSERGLKRRNLELSVLMEMSDFLSSAKDGKLLLSGALEKVIAFFRFDAGRIYLKDDNSPYLLLMAHHGMEPEGLERVHVNEGFTGRSYRTRTFLAQPVSTLQDKRRAALLKGKGLETIICVPLICADRVGGVMNLATDKSFRVDQHQIDLLTAMGNQIAVAANHAKLYDELNNKLQALREKKEMIKFFAFSVSHDLKSPALGLYGLAKRLKDKYSLSLDEKGKTYCDQILATAEHMVTLVEKINSYIATRESALNPETIDMVDLLSDIREEFKDLLKERRVRCLLPDAGPRILADKVSFIRLFRNLMDNALKYGGESMSEIRIKYDSDPWHHVLFFSDNGAGIPSENRDKIFNVFHRDPASRSVAGSGLGLAIVKEAVERHGGKISVESQIGTGTTFRMIIPKEPPREENKNERI